LPDAFAVFWKAYPRKVAKEAAMRAWKKLNPTGELADEIVVAVRGQSRWEQWTRDGGKFIPHPATWLSGKRWEDEPPQEVTPASKTTAELDEEIRREREHIAHVNGKREESRAG
jgi:hypothetical protein